ncbi:uncharacterized mitochondrial protein-like protein [Tanacetum coccineum]
MGLSIQISSDGSLKVYKARVVAQGFTQIFGLDISHTLVQLLRASICRLFYLLAVPPSLGEFAIKDLGDLSYFLGLEVSYTNDGLFLSQAKYATDVLTRAALLDSKPVSTPLAANEVFVTLDLFFANPTL